MHYEHRIAAHYPPAPDYAGRGEDALRAIFGNLIEEIKAQWPTAPKQFPEIPEPMLGEMGLLRE